MDKHLLNVEIAVQLNTGADQPLHHRHAPQLILVFLLKELYPGIAALLAHCLWHVFLGKQTSFMVCFVVEEVLGTAASFCGHALLFFCAFTSGFIEGHGSG